MYVEYRGKSKKVKIQEDKETFLDLSHKKIQNISQIIRLDELTDLTSLNLSSNNISEIKGLENLTNLKRLYLSRNQITELKGLDNLSKLEYLDISYNQLNEIKGLDKLKYITRLDLGSNNINELKGLHNLTNLNSLFLGGNPIHGWMRNFFGTRSFGQGVVEYCRKLKEGTNYDSSRVEKVLNQTMDEIESMIETNQPEWDYTGKKATRKLMELYDTIGKQLLDILKKVHDPVYFYDFFGNLLARNIKFFDVRFSEAYNSKLAFFIINKTEMESYILEKYCFLEEEYFISKFYGSISHGNYILTGRIYATNYRIIGHGIYERKDSAMVPADFLELIIWPLIAAVYYPTTKAIFEDVKRTMGINLKNKELPIFGYQFPILNAKKVKLGSKALLFKSDRSYQIVIPKSKQETKNQRIEKSWAILTPIYDHLIKCGRQKPS